jgi:hypothetical protein
MSTKNRAAPGLGHFVAALIPFALMQGCVTSSQPPVIALPNGYYLERNRGSNIALVGRRGQELLAGPIAAYRVERTTVVGCVGEWPKRAFAYPNETPFPDSNDCRYFIFDTASGRLDQGLAPSVWRARLKEMGLAQSLQITAPVLPLADAAT